MGFLIGVLTFIMVVDCLLLILLILVQLPKKEAGAGLAFGGAASDALFGAGSGTVLTKVTKYAAGTFFALAIGLAILQRIHSSAGSEFLKAVDNPKAAAPGSPAGPATQKPTSGSPVPATAPTTAGSNALMSLSAPLTNITAPTTPTNATSVPAAPTNPATVPQPGAK